jgi:hypothetical protein
VKEVTLAMQNDIFVCLDVPFIHGKFKQELELKTFFRVT